MVVVWIRVNNNNNNDGGGGGGIGLIMVG